MYDDSHLEMAYEDTVSLDWDFCGEWDTDEDYDWDEYDDADEDYLGLAVITLYADEDYYNGPTYMEYDD